MGIKITCTIAYTRNTGIQTLNKLLLIASTKDYVLRDKKGGCFSFSGND